MIFRNIEKAEDGSFLFDVEANKDEVAFLVDFAVSTLLNRGMINIDENIQATTQEVNLSADGTTLN